MDAAWDMTIYLFVTGYQMTRLRHQSATHMVQRYRQSSPCLGADGLMVWGPVTAVLSRKTLLSVWSSEQAVSDALRYDW